MALASINIYYSYLSAFEMLTDDETGRLIKGAIRYAETHREPNFTGNERFIWAMLKSQIDRDQAAYFAKCERNAENSRRYRAEVANADNRTISTDIDRYQTISKNKDKDKDKNKDKDKDKYINKRFTPPTLSDVADYCKERNNGINPEAFIDYYTSQRWTKANGRPVVDWRACIRTWERKDKQSGAEISGKPSALMLKNVKRGAV